MNISSNPCFAFLISKHHALISSFSKALFSAFVFFYASTASAIIIDGGPDWPGSADVTGSTHIGSMINGGQVSTYPNIGNSAVANLYFGLTSTGGPWFLGTSASSETDFSYFASTLTTIEYRGSANILNAQFGGSSTFQTRLTLTVNSGGSIISDATTQALGNDVHSLIHVTGASFQVTRELEMLSGGVWQNAATVFNNFPTHQGDHLISNVSTSFYWEDTPAVPVPAAVWLFGSGLIGLIGVARRK